MIRTLWQEQPTRRALRQFVLTVGLLSLAFLIWAVFTDHLILAKIFAGLLVVLLSGWLIRPLLILFYRIWMTLGHGLGFFMSRLILSLIFYLIFTPIGFGLKLFKKQTLDLKWEPQKSTYWQKRQTTQSDLTKLH